MNKIKRVISLFMCMALICAVLPISASAETAPKRNPEVYDNLEISSEWPNYSYLVSTDNGYMRLYERSKNIKIEYFDYDFNLLSKKSVEMELEEWDGFYKSEDSYYLFEDCENENQNDNTEFMRVIKYDFNWNRLGAASIKTNNKLFGGTVEFIGIQGKSMKVTEYNGKLFFATGHIGNGHEGLLLMTVDTETMQGEIVSADYAHSYTQYIENINEDIYLLELSEGNRCAQLSKYNAEDAVYPNERVHVFRYGGKHTSQWSIPVYATVEGMALSSNNILTLGASIDQSQYDDVKETTPYNLYLTVTPISDFKDESNQVKWITNYAEGEETVIGANITKVNDNCFMISWENYISDDHLVSDLNDSLSYATLHYLFVDGNGNKISEEFTVKAPLPSCQPIVKGSNIVFYASKKDMVNFYSINANTGKFSKKVYRVAGEYADWKITNGTLKISGTGAIEYVGSGMWESISDKVKKIVVKSGITEISIGSFSDFDNVEEVYIEPGLKRIEMMAFQRCKSLHKITIPPSVTEIGESIVSDGYYWAGDVWRFYDTVICGEKGSYAEKYANENNLTFEAVTITDPIDPSKLFYGNVDGDNSVTSADALLILRACVGLEDFIDEQNKFADVDNDGKVDSADSLAVLRYSVGFRDTGIQIGK